MTNIRHKVDDIYKVEKNVQYVKLRFTHLPLQMFMITGVYTHTHKLTSKSLIFGFDVKNQLRVAIKISISKFSRFPLYFSKVLFKCLKTKIRYSSFLDNVSY